MDVHSIICVSQILVYVSACSFVIELRSISSGLQKILEYFPNRCALREKESRQSQWFNSFIYISTRANVAALALSPEQLIAHSLLRVSLGYL